MKGILCNKNLIKSILTIQAIKNNYQKNNFKKIKLKKIIFLHLAKFWWKTVFQETCHSWYLTPSNLRLGVLNDNVINQIEYAMIVRY